MKKTTLIALILSLLILSACQNVGTQIPRNSADEEKGEKALKSSKVNIVVTGGPEEEGPPLLPENNSASEPLPVPAVQ
jgi:hypothetical protein